MAKAPEADKEKVQLNATDKEKRGNTNYTTASEPAKAPLITCCPMEGYNYQLETTEYQQKSTLTQNYKTQGQSEIKNQTLA